MKPTEKKTNEQEDFAEQAEKVVGSDVVNLENESDGVYTHTFNKPVLYEGKTYKKLPFDFESLSGGDSLDVENELLAQGHAVVARSIDGAYLIRMCARACTEKVGYDIFRVMSVKDYAIITNRSRRFF